MALVSYDYECTNGTCTEYGQRKTIITPRSQRDECVCGLCGESLRRLLAAPAVTGKASTLDGTSRGEDYETMKRLARLEVERAGKFAHQRADIDKEIATEKSRLGRGK